MSKAGPHIIIGPRNRYGEFVVDIARAKQTLAIVKCVDDFGPAAEAKSANQKTLTIGRINEGPHGEDLQAFEPWNYPTARAAAVTYYGLVKPKWLLNPFIDVWETFNEYSGNWSWQADFYIALLDLAEADGYRLGLWATSGGNPPLPNMPTPAKRYISHNEAKHLTIVEQTPRRMPLGRMNTTEQPWEAIARACRRAKQNDKGHLMCVHEYAWSGLLKDSWDNGVVGRYEALHDYLVSVDADIPIAITECGQNGGGGFVGVPAFLQDVEFCDARWMQRQWLVGASLWTLGRWSGANFQDALPKLAEYIIGHPTPIDPPPPPQFDESDSGDFAGAFLDVVDKVGNVWTLGDDRNGAGHAVLKNGTPFAGGWAEALLYFDGAVYATNHFGAWYKAIASSWLHVDGDPRVGVRK